MIRKLKYVYLAFVAAVLLLSGCSTDSSSEGGSSSFASPELNSLVSGMMHGWNLGNTLDAQTWGVGTSNLGTETETSWGMPVTTKSMIAAVASKGFRTIRIPVSWHNHIADLDNFRIDSVWMNRVQTVVDWALEYNLYVIINIHHDNTSSQNVMAGYGGFCISSNTAEQTASMVYINAVWKQIAEHFAEYDNKLIFEVLNEPRIINNDGTEVWNPSGSSLSSANKVITVYEQAALNVIRGTGGKNEKRYVMCSPYAASPYNLSGWELPADSAFQKLIVSVHAYSPYNFCMNSAANNKFTDSIEGELSGLFSNLNSSYVSKGIPVVMGEASSSDKDNTEDRVKWTKCYFRNAKSASIPVVLWDNMVTVSNGGNINKGECHGYFNRRNLSWYFPEIIDEIMKNR